MMCTAKKQETPSVNSLLSENDPPPFEVINPSGKGPGIVICDHASNRIPLSLRDTMGVSPANLSEHIGWDIGAADVSRHLAEKLDMSGILAGYSRLVIDMNRSTECPDSIPEVSDGVVIPGNQNLTAPDHQRRLDELFFPYQNAIGKQIDDYLAHGSGVPLLLFIHSFTPKMAISGEDRPWHIGVLWDHEPHLARTLIENLEREDNCIVGDNQPYSLKDAMFVKATTHCHAYDRNLPYLFVEFRQDMIDTAEKARHWTDILIKAMQPILNDPATFEFRKTKE